MKNGLYVTQIVNGKEWKFATALKFIEGDGMSFSTMSDIIDALLEAGFVPYSWGLFGVGGGQRNNLKRDNLSAKYALSTMGMENVGVAKFSEDLGKGTLPGPFKLLRTEQALIDKKTIVSIDEEGESAYVNFFNGTNIYEPFGPGMDDYYHAIKNRIDQQFIDMPLNLETEDNKNYPVSDIIRTKRIELQNRYVRLHR